jgi:uracil-DNA glycosylase
VAGARKAPHPPEAELDGDDGLPAPWLETELEVVKPRVLVLLGATAAQTLLGREFRVTPHRGELLASELAETVTATVHPPSILRGEPQERDANFAAFVDDLRVVAGLL